MCDAEGPPDDAAESRAPLETKAAKAKTLNNKITASLTRDIRRLISFMKCSSKNPVRYYVLDVHSGRKVYNSPHQRIGFTLFKVNKIESAATLAAPILSFKTDSLLADKIDIQRIAGYFDDPGAKTKEP